MIISDNQQDENENGGSFPIIQPHRDLEVNWEIDIAKNLENYLLKIYSDAVTNDGHSFVNFAEAAMLIEGSIKVYSRKVEYLYSLVLKASDFFSGQCQPEQQEYTSEQPEEGGAPAASSNLDDFWVPHEIEVDTNRNLNDTTRNYASLDHFVRPPADLLLLEGDGLNATGEGGELDSSLLPTCYFYRDFLLLDSRDAAAVDDFLKEADKINKRQDGGSRGSPRTSDMINKFLTPTKESAGSAHMTSIGKSQDANLQDAPSNDHAFGFDNMQIPLCNVHEINNDEFAADSGYQLEGMDHPDHSEDDPWKPLNPREPGNLKVKPFRKVKSSRRDLIHSSKNVPRTTDFPVARFDGPISSDLAKIWEARSRDRGQQELQYPPLYKKLRQSLVLGGIGNSDAHSKSKDGDQDGGYNREDHEFEPPIFGKPAESTYMDEEIRVPSNMHEDGNAGEGGVGGNEDSIPENLCHSHMDSLLSNIGGSEMQNELEARVISWKQQIEQDLKEHEARPAFDIHEYGERVLDKLSRSVDNENATSFVDVVRGQEKHDVVRSFFALLQLVNDGNVDVQRPDPADEDCTCYTAQRPFSVKLLRAKRRRGVQVRSSKKKSLHDTAG